MTQTLLMDFDWTTVKIFKIDKKLDTATIHAYY